MKRYFDHLHTMADIKTEYKRLAKLNHPDVGGDTATMQDINAQYADAVDRIRKYGDATERKAAAAETPEEFAAVISKIVTLTGIDVDLVGCWIWVTGNTYGARDTLKAAGFKFAGKKRAWYWHPADAGTFKCGKKSLDEIKMKYGSERINLETVRRPAFIA